MRNLTVLGSTGSIGSSTLDVVRRRRDRYRIFALVAGWNVDALVAQIEEFRPRMVVVATEEVKAHLLDRLQATDQPRSGWPELMSGPRASEVGTKKR